MTKFFSTLKKAVAGPFWSIFPTSYEFIAPHQNLGKYKDKIR